VDREELRIFLMGKYHGRRTGRPQNQHRTVGKTEVGPLLAEQNVDVNRSPKYGSTCQITEKGYLGNVHAGYS
jgi:hypothetical protein